MMAATTTPHLIDILPPATGRIQADVFDGTRRYIRTMRDLRSPNESRAFAKMPAEEREYLQKARENYQRSVDLYQQLGVFLNAARSRATALQDLQKVDQRMAQIQIAAVTK